MREEWWNSTWEDSNTAVPWASEAAAGLPVLCSTDSTLQLVCSSCSSSHPGSVHTCRLLEHKHWLCSWVWKWCKHAARLKKNKKKLKRRKKERTKAAESLSFLKGITGSLALLALEYDCLGGWGCAVYSYCESVQDYGIQGILHDETFKLKLLLSITKKKSAFWWCLNNQVRKVSAGAFFPLSFAKFKSGEKNLYFWKG